MIIGSLQIDLHLPACHSLKEKRSVLKRLIAKLRHSHNISVAEVDHQDAWQSARLGITVVSNETQFVDQVLQRVLRDCDEHSDIEVTGHLVEIL